MGRSVITRRDVKAVAKFMTWEKKLAPSRPPAPRPTGPRLNEPTTPEPQPEPSAPAPPAAAAVAAPEPEPDPALEAEGFALMQHRCSKCHTLSRVYGKLDGLERTLSVIERMQLKTGSGITDSDAHVLEKYVRVQFED